MKTRYQFRFNLTNQEQEQLAKYTKPSKREAIQKGYKLLGILGNIAKITFMIIMLDSVLLLMMLASGKIPVSQIDMILVWADIIAIVLLFSLFSIRDSLTNYFIKKNAVYESTSPDTLYVLKANRYFVYIYHCNIEVRVFWPDIDDIYRKKNNVYIRSKVFHDICFPAKIFLNKQESKEFYTFALHQMAKYD
ncbi:MULTISPECIES: hypothetical protein [unclassified Xenorhabdus]|uniref:hypothetical protein n=1 Tax=unclassified Xenorhabdus TaxID=2632833 RepID=UPI000C04C660|nr:MULTISPECIES: hypothetical protein [unclassified Xenorhabdus]MCC8379743.1 hypothetical protein [Xenorhabdus sp. PB30.3]PHM58574.1 hypothetical protein Xekk_01149 [Xenorhabdus sp. KK7.4]